MLVDELSVWVPEWIIATTVVLRCLEVDTGPPRTSPMGIESEWPGECHDNEVVLSECLWST